MNISFSNNCAVEIVFLKKNLLCMDNNVSIYDLTSFFCLKWLYLFVRPLSLVSWTRHSETESCWPQRTIYRAEETLNFRTFRLFDHQLHLYMFFVSYTLRKIKECMLIIHLNKSTWGFVFNEEKNSKATQFIRVYHRLGQFTLYKARCGWWKHANCSNQFYMSKTLVPIEFIPYNLICSCICVVFWTFVYFSIFVRMCWFFLLYPFANFQCVPVAYVKDTQAGKLVHQVCARSVSVHNWNELELVYSLT